MLNLENKQIHGAAFVKFQERYGVPSKTLAEVIGRKPSYIYSLRNGNAKFNSSAKIDCMVRIQKWCKDILITVSQDINDELNIHDEKIKS